MSTVYEFGKDGNWSGAAQHSKKGATVRIQGPFFVFLCNLVRVVLSKKCSYSNIATAVLHD